MPVTLTINGVPFQYPIVGDEDWGQAATAWATAITNLNAQFTSASIPLADDGQIRLGNTDTIEWRNAGDTDNVRIYVDSDDKLYYKNGANPALDLSSNANGNVTGPLTSTDEAIVRFNGGTGQSIQNSTALLTDAGALSGITTLAMNGNLTGVVGLTMSGNLTGLVDLTMTGDLAGADAISCVDLTVTDDTDLVDLDASGAIIFSGTSGHSVSEEFANEVIEEYARPVGGTVGVRGVAIATSDTGSFSTASGTPVDVTNATVTITTTGRPVYVSLISSGSAAYIGTDDTTGGGAAQARFDIVRGVTTIASHILRTEVITSTGPADEVSTFIPVGSVEHVDPVAAGTYTYKLQAVLLSGDTAYVQEAKLVAYEL